MVSMITICEIIHHQLQKDSQALCSEMSQQNSVVPNQNYHKCSYFLSVKFTFICASSTGWKASQDPRTVHHRLLHRWPGCTNFCSGESEVAICQ